MVLAQVLTTVLSSLARLAGEGGQPVLRIWSQDHDCMSRIHIDLHAAIPLRIGSEQLRQLAAVAGAEESMDGDGHVGPHDELLADITLVRRGTERMGGTIGLEPAGPPSSLGVWIELPTLGRDRAALTEQPPPAQA
jgi:hypothetical protein